MQLEKGILFFVSLMVVASNGTWLQFQYNIPVKVTLLGAAFMLFLYAGVQKRLTAPNLLLFFLVIFPLVSTYIVNLSPEVNIINVVFSSILLLLFSHLPLEMLHKILEHYSRMIFFLVKVAVPLGIIFLVAPRLIELGKPVYSPFFNSGGGHWYNFIFFTERSIQDFRVQSVFWEPGAWAFNQMVAFYYLMFVKQEYKKIPLFLLSLLLTLSTSGIIACLICLFVLAPKLNKTVLFICGGMLAIVALVVGYFVSTNEILGELFYQNTIGKFSSDSVSFEDRSAATASAFKIANEHWLFGIGRQDNESYVYVTSCLSEISYQLGYIYLLVYVVVFFQVFRPLGILAGALFCFVLLNSEAYSFFSLNLFLIALGCKIFLMRKEAFHQLWRPSRMRYEESINHRS